MAKADDEEFDRYLAYLWERDIAPLVRGYHPHGRRHMEWDYEFEYPLSKLAEADRMLGVVGVVGDPYDIFKAEALALTLRKVREGVDIGQTRGSVQLVWAR